MGYRTYQSSPEIDLAVAYPPHPAEVVTVQDKDLMAALERYAATKSCPHYLRNAYREAKAQ